jgi:sugar O-acyltransferase (sialic acid O-acetyltransferase NeuD family)
MPNLPVILIGYSGHAYVIAGIFESMNKQVIAYCDQTEKNSNPFKLEYLGTETSTLALNQITENDYFICVGDNSIRRRVFNKLTEEHNLKLPINAIHKNTNIHKSVKIEKGCVMISAGVVINPLAEISIGVICNTGCIIEHECKIDSFTHIGPGAVLCGNVRIGKNSFIGANTVVKQGIIIGDNVVVGAGSVVVKNLPDGVISYGNPAKIIR